MLFTLLILVIQFRKTDYNTKINERGKKLLILIIVNITAQEFNKLTRDNFAARLRQEN